MTSSEPDDQTRVGNPERERAITLLNNVLTDGYLDIHEFEERSTIVYSARTRGELGKALENLPGNERLFPDRLIPVGSDGVLGIAPLELDIEWTTVTRKGAWPVPGRIVITGSMGKADLDFSLAEFSQPVVEVNLQVSASTVKVRLGADQSISFQEVTCGTWSSVKDQAGPPVTSTGPAIVLKGAITGWSTATIRRS